MVAAAQMANTNTNWLPLAELLKKWNPASMKEVQRAAEKGDASAEHYLGYCFVEGLRVDRNPSVGATWYQRAMQAGYLPSANNLGLLYQRGLLGATDLAKAVYYYKFAADRGLAQAQANMGFLYRDGMGVPVDPVKAMHWFRLAADQGHTGAMVEIGRLYRFGLGVPADSAEAVHWFQRAIKERDDSLAELNLGLLYQDEGQTQKALPYFQHAAEQGSTEAMTQLYYCYWMGYGVATDHPKAMEWLLKAANAGNAYAECVLGDHYEYPDWQGSGAKKWLPKANLVEAIRWYRRSAEQNWAGGQYHLGLCYLKGKAVEVDEARGLKLVRAAADQNLEAAVKELADLYARGVGEPRNEADRPVHLLVRAKAWSDLVLRYEYGLGTARDLIMAAQYYCKGAMTHSPFYDGYSLEDKTEFNPPKRTWGTPMITPVDKHVQILGVPDDIEPSDDVLHALSFYLKSAAGDGPAAVQIGNYYLNGQNVPKSTMRAWVWFTVAARAGSSEASEKAAEVETQMTSDEFKTAKQELSEQTQELRLVANAISKKF
jgi:TPR repeat protein